MPGEFSAANRRLILLRDEERCLMCARPTGDVHHLHHRQLRSRGGQHVLANGVLMCLWCHGFVHANVLAATASGFIVSSWDEPEDIPIRSWRGLITLDATGSWAPAEIPSR